MQYPEIEVALAGEAERRLIERLAQFYVYGFSELEPADSDDFEPGADGRFEPVPHMDSYWRDDSRLPCSFAGPARRICPY